MALNLNYALSPPSLPYFSVSANIFHQSAVSPAEASRSEAKAGASSVGLACFGRSALPFAACVGSPRSLPLGYASLFLAIRSALARFKSLCSLYYYIFLVRAEGLEPPRLTAPDPKSGVSANFTMLAVLFLRTIAFRHQILRCPCAPKSRTLFTGRGAQIIINAFRPLILSACEAGRISLACLPISPCSQFCFFKNYGLPAPDPQMPLRAI